MKKSFLNFSQFPPAKRVFAPKIQSRRMGLRNFHNVAYKSDAEVAEEQKKEKEELLKAIKTQFDGELQTRGFQTKAELDTALETRMKQFEGIDLEALRTFQKTDKADLEKQLKEHKDALEAQGLELRALKDAQHKAIPDRQTIATQIRAYMEKNKEAFDKFKNRETNSFGSNKGDSAIEIRAAATMTIAGQSQPSAFVPNVEMVPGLVDLARNKPFLENYSNNQNTNSPRIVWTEKYNPQGNAAFTAEGNTKPLTSFEIRTNESYARKVADKIKVSTEMIDDIDFIAGEIETELHYKVDIAVDNSLLSGSGDNSQGATDLKGITAQVGGYVLTSISTTTPNDFDAIRAAAAQIVSLNFNPDTVFINTIDAANMDLVKDSQGRPLAMQYKDAQGKIYRLNVVETNQMPVGFTLIGDMSRFKVRNYKSFAISYGWVNDDFEKNLFTVLGERRLHSFIATNDQSAFVYDTFANIKTAITTP